MIFTDRFVYVHLPKTGGTTVTSALLRLHGVRWSRWTHLRSALQPLLHYETPHGRLTYSNHKHGTCRDIPDPEREKPVLGTVRNPYSWVASHYAFGWWKRREFLRYYRAVPDFEARFSGFPDLSFADYLTLSDEAFGRPGGPGLMTQRFVEFYGRAPEATLDRLAEDPGADLDLFDAHVLRTETLNADLHAYLLARGYPGGDIDFVLEMGRVLPGGKGRPEGESWRRHVTPALQAEIRAREAPLFARFPEYDVGTTAADR